MVKVSIVNVVATAALGQRVDLEQLGKCPRIVHDSEIYGGRVAYFRSAEFAGEVTIFASGKMISVGTKSEGEAYRALELAKEYLVEKGFVRSVDLEKMTQNIVVVVDFGHGINLEELAQEHRMVYEPGTIPWRYSEDGEVFWGDGSCLLVWESCNCRDKEFERCWRDCGKFGEYSEVLCLALFDVNDSRFHSKTLSLVYTLFESIEESDRP